MNVLQFRAFRAPTLAGGRALVRQVGWCKVVEWHRSAYGDGLAPPGGTA